MYHLDSLDRKIISFLAENAKIPFVEIARECNISAGAVHKRVEKLEEAGVITGYKVVLNTEILGFTTRAFVGVLLERAIRYSDVKKALENIHEVIESHFTTGKFGLLIKVLCKDNQHLKGVLENIHDIPGVSTTETYISIEQSNEKVIHLDAEDF